MSNNAAFLGDEVAWKPASFIDRAGRDLRNDAVIPCHGRRRIPELPGDDITVVVGRQEKADDISIIAIAEPQITANGRFHRRFTR